MKTCLLCRGFGSLFVMYNRKPEWYDCPACKGNGCREAFECSAISINRKQQKYCKRLEKETE